MRLVFLIPSLSWITMPTSWMRPFFWTLWHRPFIEIKMTLRLKIKTRIVPCTYFNVHIQSLSWGNKKQIKKKDSEFSLKREKQVFPLSFPHLFIFVIGRRWRKRNSKLREFYLIALGEWLDMVSNTPYCSHCQNPTISDVNIVGIM